MQHLLSEERMKLDRPDDLLYLFGQLCRRAAPRDTVLEARFRGHDVNFQDFLYVQKQKYRPKARAA